MKRRWTQPVGVNGVLSLFLLCIPFLVTAQQQHSSFIQESTAADGLEHPAAVESGLSLDPDIHPVRRKNTNHNIYNKNNNNNNAASDVRALATLAPSGRPTFNGDDGVLPAKISGQTGGLSSRLPARSLQDWEVEDLVLMATVDGKIHARDRNTGAHRWTLDSEVPTVQTTYHSRNSPEGDLGGGQNSTQSFYWIVEPSQDGALYGYTPGTPFGMHKLGLSVKQLVEVGPWSSDDPPVVYTGEKTTRLVMVDVNTGEPVSHFAPSGSHRNNPGVCRQRGTIESLDDDECERVATLTLGRTDYKVGIQNAVTGEEICTIKYFEWGPNKRDSDLFSQYSETKDNRYIYSLHDGSVMALDYLEPAGSFGKASQKAMYQHKFPSPVVRVFDIVRPTQSNALDIPLIILPQPNGPVINVNDNALFRLRVFVNCTESGSWYALSEMTYPLVTARAKNAQFAVDDGVRLSVLDGSGEDFKQALVGVHVLPSSYAQGSPSTDHLALPEPVSVTTNIPGRNNVYEEPFPIVQQPGPKLATTGKNYIGGFLGLLVLLLTVFSGVYWKSALKPFKTFAQARLEAVSSSTPIVLEPEVKGVELVVDAVPRAEVINEVVASLIQIEDVVATEQTQVPSAIPKQVTFAVDDNKENVAKIIEPSSEITVPALELERTATKLVATLGPADSQPNSNLKPKKGAHRGRRGGKREKEKRGIVEGTEPPDEIDSIVESVKQMGQNVTVVAEAVTRSGDGTTNGQVGLLNLHFDANKILGTGSGGTTVFEGTFEGRDVAVKRMLTVHYELALQEVSLLENSEDHPNVIRYFCRREDTHFLYIALELCQSSLADLFRDRRHDQNAMVDPKYTTLISQISNSPISAMRQLAEGLKHLHALRIVHRDIKPQNMLIAYPKKNSTTTFPRIVISDFGLCKTLPDGASTLIGATINAGTTGWKAPELIHQPRDASLISGSQNSVSNSSMNASGDPQPGAPGVKRAVDIFSLGCVFFYILTQGLHPFDDEEGWLALRERNIKTNKCNLSAIEIHGADTTDLIKWMLSPKPESRPTAAEVLAHPFFWTAEDRLEFLSLASDRFDMEPRDGTSMILDDLEDRAEGIIPPGPSMPMFPSSPPRNNSGWGFAAHKHRASSPAAYPAMASTPPPYNDETNFPALGSTPIAPSTPPPPPPAPVPELNFLAQLDRKFIDTLGKQRKYNGAKLADLLRALRNKHHHWDDMPDDVKVKVGEVPEGYLRYWEQRFPGLVVGVWRVVKETGVATERRFGRWYGGKVGQ